MALELTGKLIKILPVVEGQSQKGPWQKQEFVLETLDPSYPKKVALTAWGDKVADLSGFNMDDTIRATFSAESREYNDRWYTELRAFKIEPGDTMTPKAPAPVRVASGPSLPASRPAMQPEFAELEETDPLPF